MLPTPCNITCRCAGLRPEGQDGNPRATGVRPAFTVRRIIPMRKLRIVIGRVWTHVWRNAAGHIARRKENSHENNDPCRGRRRPRDKLRRGIRTRDGRRPGARLRFGMGSKPEGRIRGLRQSPGGDGADARPCRRPQRLRRPRPQGGLAYPRQPLASGCLPRLSKRIAGDGVPRQPPERDDDSCRAGRTAVGLRPSTPPSLLPARPGATNDGADMGSGCTPVTTLAPECRRR